MSSARRPSSVSRIARARSASPRCSDFDRSRNTARSAASAVSFDFPDMLGLHSPHPRQTIHSIVHSQAVCLGDMPLEALLRELENCQYAVLVISNDDVIVSRDAERPSPRDNVIFEAGLFMGRFGPKRSFLVYDQISRPKLPSDLVGLTYAPY